MKRIAIGIAAALLATVPSHSGDAPHAGELQLAQACGWYAISLCSKEIHPARDAKHAWGSGEVVDTSSPDFPNFAGGYYCHVVGPKGKSAAQATASRMKAEGFASAYIKNGC